MNCSEKIGKIKKKIGNYKIPAHAVRQGGAIPVEISDWLPPLDSRPFNPDDTK